VVGFIQRPLVQYQTQRKGARKFWRSKVQEQIKAQAADTSALTNIKSNLDLAWGKIQNGLQQEAEGRKLWVEGTIELINILDDARKRLGPDQAFGTWLTANGYGGNRLTPQERAALLNMAKHLDLTRDVLKQTASRSWRLIWFEEIQPRVTSAGKPPDDEKPAEAPTNTRRPKEKNGAKEPPDEAAEWLTNNTGWLNNQVTIATGVIGEVTKAMERMTAEQWDNLAKAVEPRMLDTIEQGGKTWIKLVARLRNQLTEEAETLKQQGRVKLTPARRASAQAQPSL
jgi:hypothetical protein